MWTRALRQKAFYGEVTGMQMRKLAVAADGWFGDDDSASRPAEAAKANFGLPTDFARCVTQFTDGRADAN
jgi:hypothetical protein